VEAQSEFFNFFSSHLRKSKSRPKKKRTKTKLGEKIALLSSTKMTKTGDVS
jgi:hypothetical protein